MRKLTLYLLLSVCITLCYAGQCTNFYQGINERTGRIIVEGLEYASNYVDNGEYYSQDQYQAEIYEKEDGVFTVIGSYSTNINVGVQHNHLCTQVFSQQQQIKKIQYTLTRKRDPSRIGQQYTPAEVQPDTAPTLKSALAYIVYTAYFEAEDIYVINQLQGLVDSVEVSYKPY